MRLSHSPTIVIEGKNGTAAVFEVGYNKTEVSSRFGVFGLVADAPLLRPAVRGDRESSKRTVAVGPCDDNVGRDNAVVPRTGLEPVIFTLKG